MTLDWWSIRHQSCIMIQVDCQAERNPMTAQTKNHTDLNSRSFSSFMLSDCMYLVYTVYILCIYFQYMLSIYYVYTQYILSMYSEYTQYILSIYSVHVLYIIAIKYVYAWYIAWGIYHVYSWYITVISQHFWYIVYTWYILVICRCHAYGRIYVAKQNWVFPVPFFYNDIPLMFHEYYMNILLISNLYQRYINI